MQKDAGLIFAYWLGAEDAPPQSVRFAKDSEDLPQSLQELNVVMAEGDEARAEELLARGAACVLLGDLALDDREAVKRLIERHGGERIGLCVQAQKTSVSWTLMEEAPNAGFRVMMPSVCIPSWDVLRQDGSPTKERVDWWLEEMFALGVGMALICMDMQDDDLNHCAGLIEDFGARLWFSPRYDNDIDLEPWVRWGKVRQLLLPNPNTRDEATMARLLAIAPPAVTVTEPVASSEALGGNEKAEEEQGTIQEQKIRPV